MRIRLRTRLKMPADAVWRHVRTPALMRYVSAPWVTFEPVGARWPEQFDAAPLKVRMKFLGVLPLGRQTILVSLDMSEAPGRLRLYDRGGGSLIPKWVHRVTVDTLLDDAAELEDWVEMRAGLLTLPAAAFVWLLLAWRQHRWRELARQGFAPLNPDEDARSDEEFDI